MSAAEEPVFAPVHLRDVALGSGRPKIMVSVTEPDATGAIAAAKHLAEIDGVDLVEFRIDHLDRGDDPGTVAGILPDVADAAGAKPLVVTFRTRDQGGEKAITPSAYAELYAALLTTGRGDAFDMQAALLSDPEVVAVQARLQAAGRKVILSHHDFHQTPSVDTMIVLLQHQQELGADICKLAVMPKDQGDVLRLLEATWRMRSAYADRPLITMSMRDIGAVSRLTGEVFGSALSFGAVGSGSAPGQIPVSKLLDGIEFFHMGSYV